MVEDGERGEEGARVDGVDEGLAKCGLGDVVSEDSSQHPTESISPPAS